jgi:hypothetical protein
VTRQSHARLWYSSNWGVLHCACGAVAHEELVGHLLVWHAKHKREMRAALAGDERACRCGTDGCCCGCCGRVGECPQCVEARA